MGRKFSHLTWTQRLQLESYLKANLPVKKICELMEVSDSTIYRERQRGKYLHTTLSYIDYFGEKHYKEVEAYSAYIAEKNYRLNLAAKGPELKLSNDYEFAEYLERRIGKDKMSPSAVLGEIKHKKIEFKTSICPTTLYSYIEKGVFFFVVS